MAEGMQSRILRAPSRVIVGPTDLSEAAPYGGKYVGHTKSVALVSTRVMFRVEDEGLGEATDVLESKHQYVFSCFLRGWDDDAVQLLFPGHYSAGAVSGRAVFQSPGTRLPGRSALSRGQTILIVPDDVDNMPACLMHRVIVDVADQSQLDFSAQRDLGITLRGECLRGSAVSRILDVGRLADLSLS